MSAFNELLTKANKWENKIGLGRPSLDTARKRFRTDIAPDVTERDESTADHAVNQNADWQDLGGKKVQHEQQRAAGMNAKQIRGSNSRFYKPADPNRLPKSMNTKNKSVPTGKKKAMATGPTPVPTISQTAKFTPVKQQGMAAARNRATTIRANSPTAGFGKAVGEYRPMTLADRIVMRNQQSYNLRDAGESRQMPSYRAAGIPYRPAAKQVMGEEKKRFPSKVKPLPKSMAGETDVAKSALHNLVDLAKGSTSGFDLEAFDKENPVYEGDSSWQPFDERKINSSKLAKPKKAPNADTQANRMTFERSCSKKSVQKKTEKCVKAHKDTFSAVTAVKEISREAFKNMPKQQRIPDKRFKKPKYKNQDWDKSLSVSEGETRVGFLKSLDPMVLPQTGSTDRRKFDKAYNSWKAKDKPADWKPLNEEEIKHLNRWAATGHKQAIHDLLDDKHWRSQE